MNITLLVNKDLASCLAINYLLPQLAQHRLSIFLSSRVGSKKLTANLEQLRLVEQDLPNELIFPLQCSRNAADTELIGFPGIKERLEGRLGELNDINSESGLARFAATEPQLVLSIRYGTILRDRVIRIPQRGVLNLHSGRLPDYRGIMATFWALLNDESHIGTTLHTIDSTGIDAGSILAETTLPVQKERSYLWHVLELYRDGCQSMGTAVHAIANGDTPATRQQRESGQYFSFPTAADLDRFHAMGWCLFDNKDVVNIYKCFMQL